MATPKRPRDPIQLAKLIGDIAIGEVEDIISLMRLFSFPSG
jgi:hypothetical protein